MNWNRTEAEIRVELEQAYKRIAELESAAGGSNVTERNRVEAARRESERRLRSLLEISQAMSAPLEMSTILQKIVENIVGLVELDSGAIYTLQGDELFLEATTPPLPPGLPVELRRAAVADHPYIQAALVSGATVILPDTTAVELSSAEKMVAEARGLRSIAYFPLMIADRAIGVLIVASVNRLRTFDDEEIALYAGYSGQAAQTIENARLYQAERAHAAELEAQVAERKQAEQALRLSEGALRASEAKYRLLVDASIEGIWSMDREHHTTYVNPSMAGMLGYEPAEMLGKKVEEFFFAEDMEFHQARMENRHRGQDEKYERRFRRRDGSQLWTLVSARVQKDAQGNFDGSFAMFTDITSRKQAEDTLANTERRYRALIENAPDGIVLVSLDGRFKYASPAVTRLFGYTQDEALAGDPNQLTHPEDLPMVLTEIAALIENPTHTPTLQYRFLHKNGEWRWIESTFSNLLTMPSVEGISINFRDIHARKRAEDALRASEEKYRSLIKSLNNAISVVDTHGQLLFMNDRAAEDLGGSPQALIGRNLVDLFPEPFGSLQLAAIQKVFQSDQETVYEAPTMVKGGLRWFRVAFQPLHDESGQAVQVLVNATDIHDLKSAQEELQVLNRTLEERVAQRTAEVQDLYENAPTGYHSLDANGNFVRVNQTELNWLGYAREEMIGRAIQDFATEASHGVFLEYFPLLLQRGWMKDTEFEFVRKDGSILPVSLNATAIRDEAGNFVMSRSTLFDITERKRAENELRRNVNFTSALLNSIPTPVFYKDKEGRYLGCNRAFAELMGKTSAEIAGKLPHQIWSAEHADVYRQTDIDLLHSQEIQTYESTVNDKDGNIRPVIFVKSLFLDESGKTAGLVGAFIDISERKRTENALREREEQNRLLFEESPVPIALLDETGHIIQANRAYEQLAGIRRSDLYGKTPVEMGMVDAQVNNNLADAMIEAMSKQENFAIVEHPLTSADGTRRTVESRIYLLPINSINHILVTTNDITTHKAAEETLRQANVELERAMRMKDEFLATMSHELRTPLTGILGLSEALQLQVYGGLNEKQMKAVNNVENSGRHLLELINDILDLSKIEAGRLELQIARCSLEEICQASLHLTKGMAQQRRQHVHYAAPIDPILLDVDVRRIKQVLVNLLSNAIKFTPENGELGLIVDHDHVNRQVRLIVWDEGIGIKPENLSRLFQPFTQIDGSLAREYSGTGLGLALVRRLVELHNGSVAVESVFGEGSRFIVTLPWIPQTVQVDAPGGGGEEAYVETVDENRSAPVIFIADDNHILLDLLADFLEAQKYRIAKAPSGKELLAKIENIKPVVILMDIQMPSMDGLETIHRVRNHPDAVIAATPIIALTALAMPGDRERCLAAGANEYMSKPLNLKNLVAVIRDLTPTDLMP